MNAPPMHEPASSAHVRPASIQGQHFQVVIVGAGINGIGVFRLLLHTLLDVVHAQVKCCRWVLQRSAIN